MRDPMATRSMSMDEGMVAMGGVNNTANGFKSMVLASLYSQVYVWLTPAGRDTNGQISPIVIDSRARYLSSV